MHADLLFVNGHVFTADPAAPRARAVAVRDGRVVAVGDDHDVRDLRGPGTEVVDLAGRLLAPGFQDAHAHPVMGGLERLRCDLSGIDDRRGYLDAVAAYAAARPDDEWITGGGWSMDAFPGGTPVKEDLDAIVPGRPVFLPNRDHHSAWVNSAALRAAGITRDTPDPASGRIERDAAGEPTGTLHEGAMALVEPYLPETGHDDYVEALLVAQAHLHSLGITAWQDAILGEYAGHRDATSVYLDVARSGRLTARVRGALWWDRDRGAEQIPDLIGRRTAEGGFAAASVKIMLDGVAENFTAAMHEPYLDGCGCVTGNRGLGFVDYAELPRYVTMLDAEGFQVHFHAIGDRAVTAALDAVAAARTGNGPSGNRHHVAHIQVVRPQDVPRFAEEGVTANMQPFWACHEPQMDELTIPYLGEERAAWQYPFGALHRAGAPLAMGSDWPVSSPDPIWGIHVAVNRARESGTAAFLPGQALDLATALTAYTAGSARVNHLDETGTIAPGMLADLVVLDRDPFAAPVEEIAAARAALTYVAGRQVYAA
ncbi:amidohydrolase [Microbispora sp. CA-102843]|uniref:amidohydrolase n=1 Tax=Microbispora sp. CA-102843 TaxID=3239952 RepID=UPI003D8D691A